MFFSKHTFPIDGYIHIFSEIVHFSNYKLKKVLIVLYTKVLGRNDTIKLFTL